MKRAIISLCLVIILAGCATIASPTNQPGASSTEESSVIQITATPGGLVVKGVDVPVITLERSGGIAGGTETWTYYADGRVVSDKHGEQKIDPAQVQSLVDDIVGLKFFDMGESPSALGTCNDCYQYSITLTADGQSKTVTVVQGATNASAGALKVVEMINNLTPSSLK